MNDLPLEYMPKELLYLYFLLIISIIAAAGMLAQMSYFKMKRKKRMQELGIKLKKSKRKEDIVLHGSEYYVWRGAFAEPVILKDEKKQRLMKEDTMSIESWLDFLVAKERHWAKQAKREIKILMLYPRAMIVSFLIVLILIITSSQFTTMHLIILATIILLIPFYELFTARVLMKRHIGLRFTIFPKDDLRATLAEIEKLVPCAIAIVNEEKIKIVMHCKEPKAELLRLWNTGKVNRII